MILTVSERFALLNILPKEGNFDTLKMLRVFREELSLSEEENEAVDMKSSLNTETNIINYNWDEKKDPQKNLKLGEKMNDLIVKTLKNMNDRGTLTDDHFTLYEKFVVNQSSDVVH